MTQVKICGLSEPETLTAAFEAGADFVGFVFYRPSPRFVELEIARELASYVPENVKAVGLFVDPLDAFIDQVVNYLRLDMIQLHGQGSPERIKQIKARTGLPVMKAINIKHEEDLAHIDEFKDAADWLLLDSPAGKMPGGTGERFDWSLLKSRDIASPWMLAGGLDNDNVTEAVKLLNPSAVDVSSSVETAPGQKDAAKIREFIATVKALG